MEISLPKQNVEAMLLPLRESQLVFPDSMVVEIIDAPEICIQQNSPQWIAGHLSWRTYSLPVLDFDVLHNGDEALVSTNKASKVAVINTLRGKNYLPFYAIAIYGNAELVMLDSDNIQSSTTHKIARADKTVLQIDGKKSLIPHIEWMEEHLLSYEFHHHAQQ